jgi:hypothetical protein
MIKPPNNAIHHMHLNIAFGAYPVGSIVRLHELAPLPFVKDGARPATAEEMDAAQAADSIIDLVPAELRPSEPVAE